MEPTTIFIKFLDFLTSLPLKILVSPIRLIYPLKKLENEIYIRPRISNPLSFNVRVINPIPHGIVTLEIINASLMNIFIEKFCIDSISLNDGTHIISNICFSDQKIIKRGTAEVFFQQFDLNGSQVKKLQEIKDKPNKIYKSAMVDCSLNLEIKFYGRYQKRFRIEVVLDIT